MDGDIVFLAKNFSVIEKLKGKVEKAGYRLSARSRSSVKNGVVAGGFFSLTTTNWGVELWGFSEFDTHLDVARGVVPTVVLFAGEWVNLPHNPGRFARNRYGPGIYQHQEHWSKTGHSSSWTFYTPGRFLQCPEPGQS